MDIVQEDSNFICKGFVDGAYDMGFKCIKSYFKAICPGAKGTESQKTCNQEIRTWRQEI